MVSNVLSCVRRVGEEGEAMAGSVQVTPKTRASRVTKSSARRTRAEMKIHNSGRGDSSQTLEQEEKVEELKEEVGVSEVVEGVEDCGQCSAENTLESVQEDGKKVEVEEPVVEDVGELSIAESEISTGGNVRDSLEQEKPGRMDVNVVFNAEASDGGIGKDVEQKKEVGEESGDDLDKEKLNFGPSKIEENVKVGLQGEATEAVKEFGGDERVECGEKLDLGENEDELRENDTDDPTEETKALEQEQMELTAIVKARKNRKEREVFVGGLDRDAAEEDVRKVFQKMGEIVEIRLHKSLSTNKNRGYAFVEYAKKEDAQRALLEMKNPVV